MLIELNKSTDEWCEFKFKDDDSIDNDYYSQDDYQIFLYGHPYSSKESSWITAKDIYRLLKTKEEVFINYIDGFYAILILDNSKKKCHIYIDPYKVYNFFLYKDANRIFISTSVTKIANELPKVKFNNTAVIELLYLGKAINNKTIIEGINKLSMGTKYSINKFNELSKERYFDYSLRGENYSVKEWAEVFVDHVNKGLNLSEKVSLPLTGGVDSRTILAAALERKDKLRCYTHGLEKSSDVKIAKKISNSLNLHHSHFNDLNKDFIENILNISATLNKEFEGMADTISFSHLPNSFSKASKEADVFFLGSGGGILKSQYTKSIKENLNIEAFVDNVRRSHMKYEAPSIIDSENIKKTLNNSILEIYREFVEVSPENVDQLFYLHHIGDFASNTIRIIGKKMKVFDPFLSKDLLTISLNTAFYDREQQLFHKFLIKSNVTLKNTPTDKGIKFTNSISNKIMPKLIQFNKITKYGLNKIFKIPFDQKYFTNYPRWVKDNHKQKLDDTISYDHLVLKKIISKNEYIKYYNDYKKGSLYNFKYISRIYSMEDFMKSLKS
ncbi:asparagine synthase-related protein [Halobacillus sp. Marseille-P3879]|uniref:asparagine synthase-related protein n=1 Tax=Halobacillus sp. Marseille-P3879 TaxID=2045014 RepID=UPI000C7C0B1E|nr:asparagine synthase-related protein [Halobacillus sp. Marseille-P3879]